MGIKFKCKKTKLRSPKQIHDPFLNINHNGIKTDPFVFGEHFYYLLCRQHGILKDLEAGSILIFGSVVNKRFRVDNVLVVEFFQRIDRNNYDFINVPIIYKKTVLDTIYNSKYNNNCCGDLNEHYLYKGANYTERIYDTFSFSPCVGYKEKIKGENYSNLINYGVYIDVVDNKYLNLRLSLQDTYNIEVNATPQKIKKYWDDLTSVIYKKGYNLGIYTEMPKIY